MAAKSKYTAALDPGKGGGSTLYCLCELGKATSLLWVSVSSDTELG